MKKIRFIETDMGLFLSVTDYIELLKENKILSPKQADTMQWKFLKDITKKFASDVRNNFYSGFNVPMMVGMHDLWLDWVKFSFASDYVLANRKTLKYYQIQNAIDSPHEIRTNTELFEKCELNITSVNN